MNCTIKISATTELSIHQKRLSLIGSYLKELRIEQELTQYELAILIGISRNNLQRAESGRNITFLTISKISDFFGLSLMDLFIDVE